MTVDLDPTIVTRAAQPYVGVRGVVTMSTISAIADRLPGLIGWLGQRQVTPASAPFLRYVVIDMQGSLEVEAGVPVAGPVEVDGDVFNDIVPAGRYVTATHVGHPSETMAATTALLAWAAERDLVWDATESDVGTRWGGRFEVLLTNPAEQPDWSRFETELAFRLAD